MSESEHSECRVWPALDQEMINPSREGPHELDEIWNENN